MQTRIKLSIEDKIRKRIDVDSWELQIRVLEQNNELMERDLKDDMPNKRQRLKIRQNNVEIERVKHDVKVIQKMLREGEEIIEEVTPEDIKKFEETKLKEKEN